MRIRQREPAGSPDELPAIRLPERSLSTRRSALTGSGWWSLKSTCGSWGKMELPAQEMTPEEIEEHKRKMFYRERNRIYQQRRRAKFMPESRRIKAEAATKEEERREIERDDLGRFNVIKKNKLTGEIDNLEKQIAKEKRELSFALKQREFETASEFMKVFRELKGQVDGYNRKATEWNEQKRQIEALNKRIISGEMSIESAIQFMDEREYMAKTVQIKVSELPEDVSIRAGIARSRQKADEHNRSRQQRDRDRNSRGAR